MQEQEISNILLKCIKDCNIYAVYNGKTLLICGNPTLTMHEKGVLMDYLRIGENEA